MRQRQRLRLVRRSAARRAARCAPLTSQNPSDADTILIRDASPPTTIVASDVVVGDHVLERRRLRTASAAKSIELMISFVGSRLPRVASHTMRSGCA